MTRAIGMTAVVLLGIAVAAPAARGDDDSVHGIVVYGTTPIDGVVTDTAGAPVAGIDVHVVSSAGGETTVKTDRTGTYRVRPRAGAAYTLVYARGDVKLAAASSTMRTLAEGEAIEIREVVPPAVLPQPRTPGVIPPYTDAAIDRNAWTRAWLVLDVDERGVVIRVKRLLDPGHGLEARAVAAAFELRFEPAKDRAGRPTRALLLWTFEWPSYWWMRERRAPLHRLPGAVRKVPCHGSGPTRTLYRDCRKPDLARVFTSAWIERPAD